MKRSLIALTLALLTLSSFAQEVSVKKEISLFGISYARYNVPTSLVAGVDAQIKGVFVNLGRFDVIGLSYRMDNITPDQFISKIKEYKEATARIPEAVQLGEQQFTYADYQKLVGGFLLVIPQITNYIEDRGKGSNIEVTVDTSFTFIDVETMKAVAVINMSTDGKDTNAQVAAKDAVDAIASRLTYEIKLIEQFQLKTGIVEVQKDGSVVLELGSGMGILPGYEFRLKSTDSGSFGFQDSTGLVIIKKVAPDFSEGYVVYGNPTIGAPLQEIPRAGGEFEPYFAIGPRNSVDGEETRVLLGFKAKGTLGFFGVYPTGHVDLDPSYLWAAIFDLIPLNVFIGGEGVLMMGRVDLHLGGSVGGTGVYQLSDNADQPLVFSHLGAKVDLGLNYLLSDDAKLSLFGGGRFMLGFWGWGGFFNTYNHVYGGAGITFKL